jgi:hypothetical protein
MINNIRLAMVKATGFSTLVLFVKEFLQGQIIKSLLH